MITTQCNLRFGFYLRHKKNNKSTTLSFASRKEHVGDQQWRVVVCKKPLCCSRFGFIATVFVHLCAKQINNNDHAVLIIDPNQCEIQKLTLRIGRVN